MLNHPLPEFREKDKEKKRSKQKLRRERDIMGNPNGSNILCSFLSEVATESREDLYLLSD